MTTYTRRIIVVTARVAAKANSSAKLVDLVGGERTFTVPLSATGQEPASHYWCNWAMTPTEDTNIRRYVKALIDSGDAWVFSADRWTPEQVLARLGLKRIETPM